MGCWLCCLMGTGGWGDAAGAQGMATHAWGVCPTANPETRGWGL